MSTDIYNLLGSALATQQKQASALRMASARAKLAAPAAVAGPPASSSAAAPEPIILLNKFPIVLTPGDYANALSSANPGGDMRSLWRFRQLVDPLPQFASFYTASNLSTEVAYMAIVAGAVAKNDSPFVTGIIANAQRAVAQETYPDLDGTPGRWRPVFAVPDDWYNSLKNSNSLNHLNLDLSGLVMSATPPATPAPVPSPPPPPPRPLPFPLGKSPRLRLKELAVQRIASTAATRMQSASAFAKGPPLAWKMLGAGGAASTVAPSAGSKVTSAQVSYLMVSLSRPWMDMSLFKTAGWYLDGQEAGFCSSGKNDGNGLMPLVPSSLIIGTSAAINANWSQQDNQLIAKATAARQQLFLGPLPLNNVQTDGLLYVLGWVMNQVPFSPLLAAPDYGT